ncbi:MAG: hypothetical protein JRJ27_04200, partial [Deltaproteobacteria bacterium]|nr:hypothetical protein [Deltaproteobacteria bacterium]
MNQEQNRSPEQTVKDKPVEYRTRKKRYPWWVKTVDRITTETDDSRFKKPDMHSIMHVGIFESDKFDKNVEQSKAYVANGVKENIPGRTLPDLA